MESVSLAIFDLSGRLIKTLNTSYQNAGFCSFELNTDSERMAGMYLFQLTYGDKTICKKVVIN